MVLCGCTFLAFHRHDFLLQVFQLECTLHFYTQRRWSVVYYTMIHAHTIGIPKIIPHIFLLHSECFIYLYSRRTQLICGENSFILGSKIFVGFPVCTLSDNNTQTSNIYAGAILYMCMYVCVCAKCSPQLRIIKEFCGWNALLLSAYDFCIIWTFTFGESW